MNHTYETFRNIANSFITSEKSSKVAKKFILKQWRKQYINRYRNTEKVPYLINMWTREEDFEVRNMVAIFKNSQKAMEYIEENFSFERDYNNSPYDCTGQWFSEGARMKIIGNRIFVTEKSYLDV